MNMNITSEMFDKAMKRLGDDCYKAGYERGFEDGLDAALKALNKEICDHRVSKEAERISTRNAQILKMLEGDGKCLA